MYLSRGNPVVYYGDEQGFTGDGGDQDARQDMFPSQVASYNDDDLIGTDATTAAENFDPRIRCTASIARARRRCAQRYTPLRDGAQQHRWSSDGPGVYAFSRLDRAERREFVVAVNNAEQAQTAAIPTYAAGTRRSGASTARARARLTSRRRPPLSVTVEPLSAVVYRAAKRLPQPRSAPAITLARPRRPARPCRDPGRPSAATTSPR